jgi:murein DD-endopeptidase MepM/ murein hydrolase activator NlpD
MISTNFNQSLFNITKKFTPVINPDFLKIDYFPIDLSPANYSLTNVDLTSSLEMERYINNYLLENNKKVAYGGYLEKRAIYQRSTHFNQQNAETERNIHLGVDLWVEAGTEVLAVFDGEIHSFQDNTNFGDYGPTIILRHQVDGITFHTLYGHLSRESLKDLKVGQPVKKGEVIARLGDAAVNGDYAPHLHFQVIKDIGVFKGDYPGVCSKQDVAFYSKNCPDPNLLLKILS